MPKLCEHRMLKQCSSIHAQTDAEQCSTDEPNVLTHKFCLLEHQSHLSYRAQGG